MSILITGGTGSFGQAFARRALAEGVERVCIFSRGEHTQAAMRGALEEHPNLRWLIGDVRDRDRLRHAMRSCEVVVHAAALKRIEVGHYNPIEITKTNVGGAINVIEAAHDAGVKKVVALSSDKAFQPISAYGQSKALAESLFLAANYARGQHGPCFTATRYGNIFNSAGSVLPTWRRMRAEGRKAVPITDPECTRFFMTMRQAVDLVWNTLLTMEGGELVIPEDLPAYRLGDLAEALEVDTEVIGLPPHEKRHECMRDGLCSNNARKITVAELRGEIERA